MKTRTKLFLLLLMAAQGGCKTPPAVTEKCQSSPTAAASAANASHRVVSVDRSLLDNGRITLASAERKTATDEMLVSGQVVAPPHAKAEIGALLTARVESVEVLEGNPVKKGQILATLVAPDAARISGELAAARARRARAETVLSQEQKLLGERATSARAFSEATSEAEAARADELAANLLLGTYNVQGGRLVLRAPLAGVVAASHTTLGAQVDAGTILFRIIDPERLAIRADVPESMADSILLGKTASVRLPQGELSCTAEIVASTRSVDPIKRTVSFRLHPAPTCATLLEGGFVDLELPLEPQSFARGSGARPGELLVAVPRDAVVELDGVPSVFVARDRSGQFHLVPVEVARHGEVRSWIRQGLTGGERVVVRGALLLKGEWMRSRLE